jgi:hypothetical protein
MTELIYLDCCLSDFFQGFSEGEVIAVPVDNQTTLKDIKDGIESDYNSTSSDPIEGFDDALENMFEGKDMNSVFDKYLEPFSDDGETVYLYIGVVTD